MEPFGPENMRPVFIVRKVADNGWSRIVKKITLSFHCSRIILFLAASGLIWRGKFPLLQSKQLIDVVFTLDENEWNGNKNLQLKVIDCMLSEN